MCPPRGMRFTPPPPDADEASPSVVAPVLPEEPEVDGARLRAAEALFLGILDRHCGGCHGRSLGADANAEPGPLEFTDDIARMVALGLIVPFSAPASRVMNVMVEGSMPPPDVEPRPTGSEIEAIREFIEWPLNWPDEPPRYADWSGSMRCFASRPDRTGSAGSTPLVDCQCFPRPGCACCVARWAHSGEMQRAGGPSLLLPS